MFPLVQNQIDEETLRRLGTQMEQEKARFTGGTTRVASAVG